MMIKTVVKNLDNDEVSKLFISKFHPILALKKEWGTETQSNYNDYYFTDTSGCRLVEDEFLASILVPRMHRVKIYVEKFVPVNIKIEGFDQFSASIDVGLSISTDALKEIICEYFVLPRRDMILRTKEKYLVTSKSLRQQSIDKDAVIVSDFIYVIHTEGINNSDKQATTFCYASESTWKILDSKQPVNCQRLYYEDTLVPIRHCICDTLKDFGGLYQEEFFLLLECKMTIYVNHPRRSRKTKQYTVTRIVWPVDPISVVSNETDTGPVVALWQNQLFPLNTTFKKANITEHALIAVGNILTLKIIDKRMKCHIIHSPHTATVLEVKSRIDEVITDYDPYSLKMDETWLNIHDSLEELKIVSDSVLFMAAKPYETSVICDYHEYQLGSLKEDISYEDLRSYANNILKIKLNEKTIFECKCGSLLKNCSDQHLTRGHTPDCMTNSSRCFIAHRQVRIKIELDSAETVEITESLRTKVFKIVNALIPEDEMGLHLVEGDKVYDKNRRLSDYISPSTEEIEVKLTRPNNFSSLRRTGTFSHLDLSRMTSENRTERSLITVTTTDICEVNQTKLRSSSSMDRKISIVDLETDNGGEMMMKRLSQHVDRKRSTFRKIEMNEEEFFRAAEKSDYCLLAILLENGVNVNSQQIDGTSALYIAAQDNAVDVIELLLQHKADVDIQKINGATPLFIAVYEDNLEAVKLLLENGAKTETKVSGGITPIILAANNGNVKIVEQLCYYGAEVDQAISTGATALFKAVQMNHYDVAKMLLLNGANVNVVLETGTTPLMRAVNDSFLSLVRLLLEFGANINYARPDGTTCLHICAQMNGDKMCSLLINWGANINASLVDGATPLHIAVYHNSVDTINVLLSSGSVLNEPWLDGATPLHIAAILGAESCAQSLLEFGADPNKKMDDGATPFFVATQENRLDMLKLFVEFNANMNIPRNDGVTPIEMAHKLGLEEIAKFLKEKGARHSIACRTQ